MSLADVSGPNRSPQAPTSWLDVIEAATEHTGASPEAVWIDALERAGSQAGRQDEGSDEWTTNCPNPGHNGGSADGGLGDSKASLRWRVADDGQVIFDCRGNCGGDDVIQALGLTWLQLKWGKTGYLYRDTDRRLMAIHTKTAAKRFAWIRPAEGEAGVAGKTVAGRGDASNWTDRLWLWPDLIEWAGAARGRGARVCLWIVEGERDVENVAGAIGRGWGPRRIGSEGDGEWVDLVTTAGDGANGWSVELANDATGLRPDKVMVLADNDEAGVKQAGAVVTGLIQAGNASGYQFDIEAIGWMHSGVKDATDALSRWGSAWLGKASAVADADEYRWGSHKTGWLLEIEATDRLGEGTGEPVLGRLVFSKKDVREEAICVGTVRVKNVLINEDGETSGWEIAIGQSEGSTTALVMMEDLGSGLTGWNSRVGLFIVSVRGVGEAFGAYLRHHGARAPRVVCYEHAGWVKNDTFITEDEGVIVGPEVKSGDAGEAGLGAGSGARVQDVADLWHFGLRGVGGAERAAALVAEIGSFRDWDESGPVLGWLAGVMVAPYALEEVGTGAVPGLQAIGTSGRGKTRWIELAVRLFGLKGGGIGSVTMAGLIRALASSTAVLWIDDANLDDRAGDLLRGAITGGSRARGNIDGSRGITKDASAAALLYSAESGFRLNEKAMRERCAVVRFNKSVQQRKSLRPGVRGLREDGTARTQYEDMLELGSGNASRSRLLTDYAGVLVRELAGEVRSRRVKRGGADWKPETGIGAGLREAAAYRFCVWGAELLCEWLRRVGGPEGEETARALMDGVMLWALREIGRAEKAEKSGVAHYLVTEMLPRASMTAQKSPLWAGNGGGWVGYVEVAEVETDGDDGEVDRGWGKTSVAAALRSAWSKGVIGGTAGVGGAIGIGGGGVERGPSPIVWLVDHRVAAGGAGGAGGAVDGGNDGVIGLAVSSDLLYNWASSEDGRRAGVKPDPRYVDLDAIRAQLTEVGDKTLGGVRVQVGSSHNRATYRVITDMDVLDRIRGGKDDSDDDEDGDE